MDRARNVRREEVFDLLLAIQYEMGKDTGVEHQISALHFLDRIIDRFIHEADPFSTPIPEVIEMNKRTDALMEKGVPRQ